MKKGFNLVEIVVVLLIIGIISGILIKGKENMDAASIRAEIHKIEKIRDAVATMMTFSNAATALEKSGDTIQKDIFYKIDLLSKEDFSIYASSTPWEIKLCSETGTSDITIHEYNEDYTSLCAFHEHYYVNLICNAEFMIDDQSTSSGYGIVMKNDTDNLEDTAFGDRRKYNCDNVSAFKSATTSYPRKDTLPRYSFMVYR